MTDQEQHMIDDLVDRIRKTPVADKDVEAERHLQQTLGTVPDALYILAQTVLVQQYGLTQAQAQLEALQNEVEQLRREHSSPPPKSGSFLSRIFGADDTPPQAPPSSQGYAPPSQQGPPAGSSSGYQPVNYVPAPQGYPPPPYGAPGYGAGYPPAGYGQGGYGNPGMFGGGGGGGGFLRGALQTAAGVAAGAMVFQGMEDLFRGFGSHEGRGLGSMPGESVVNNYYGDEAERGSSSGDDRGLAGGNDAGFYNPGQDASRQDPGGESRGFADVDSDSGNSGDDSSNNFDDNSNDDSDSGSDDGGGFDGGDDSNY